MRHPFCKLCERLHHSECRRDDIGLNPACAKILTHGHYPLNLGDKTFQWLIQQVDGRMIVLSDTGFHAAEGDPANLKLCQRGEWQDRMLVETVLSMLTLVCHLKTTSR